MFVVRTVVLLLFCQAAWADTIYLCRNYGGGEFWAPKVCSSYGALILRMTSVPGELAFDQQVSLAQSAQSEGERLAQPPPVRQTQSVTQTSQTSNTVTCASLAQQVTAIDQLARQPQSGASQDRLSASKRVLRDQQFRLRCQ